MKKSNSCARSISHPYHKVIAGLFAAGIIWICFSMPYIAFADATEPVQSDVQSEPEPRTADPNTVSPQAEPSATDEPKASNEGQAQASDSWRVVHMRVTAYCPCSRCCGEYADGITADNHRIQEGDRFVAADKTYPFGTEMVIPGYHNSTIVEVKDRGGAIQGDRLDVFFNTHQEALEWGVQYLDVKIKNLSEE